MKIISTILVLSLVALVASSPDDDFLDISLEDIHHAAAGAAGQEVTGSYSWISPDGNEYLVTYVANEHGFRVLESNAVPVSGTGVSANGQQVSFDSFESPEDFD